MAAPSVRTLIKPSFLYKIEVDKMYKFVTRARLFGNQQESNIDLKIFDSINQIYIRGSISKGLENTIAEQVVMQVESFDRLLILNKWTEMLEAHGFPITTVKHNLESYPLNWNHSLQESFSFPKQPELIFPDTDDDDYDSNWCEDCQAHH